MADPAPPSPQVTAAEAMEVAEAARETEWKHPSFAAELFLGRFRPDLVLPYPEQDETDRRTGDEYLRRLGDFLRSSVDADEIDRTRDLPRTVLRGLADLGAFGMKIPKEYGGLGLSQVNYNRAIALVASHCGATAVWLSAHQSIGVPQPLKIFGTQAQKNKYLPALAKGAISAFALTEPDVGSDPARMSTTATPTEDGRAYLLNGEKLWCTNGPVADLIVVMAVTPPRPSDSPSKGGRRPITAFVVETKRRGFFGETLVEGFEVVHRCDFMGIRGIQNGLLRLRNVRVPRENVIGEEGRGLKVALVTLNTGRLTLPAACVGMAKQCLRWTRRWARERVQWGQSIGKHEAIAAKIASMASTLFAMEAVTYYASALVDRGGADIRLEAAMAKMFCSEAALRIADETVQVRGGRGYETAPSLRERGEDGIPAERALRDARINTIIEGSSEIMRLFIAREAIDPHMRAAGDVVLPGRTREARLAGLGRAAAFYASWYPTTFLPGAAAPPGPLDHHLDFVATQARRLGRGIFHRMVLHGPALERRQVLLSRYVEIGTDLFAISAAVSRARSLIERAPDEIERRRVMALADLFSRGARRRVAAAFAAAASNDDREAYALARDVLDGRYEWLEAGALEV